MSSGAQIPPPLGGVMGGPIPQQAGKRFPAESKTQGLPVELKAG